MALIEFLIGFPILIALIMLFIKGDKLRAAIVIPAVVIIMAASIVFAVMNFGSKGEFFTFDGKYVSYATMAIDALVCVFIVYMCARYKKFGIMAFVIGVTALVLVYELCFAEGITVDYNLYFDRFSLIMALIIGIIGGGIIIYALGYMKDHMLHHPDEKDNRNKFFAVFFLFLAAMYGIIFSNNLNWMMCAWEVTTVSSFYLIGYTRTDEAIKNSFRQLWMNMLGGLGFEVAIIISGVFYQTFELDLVISLGSAGYALLPVTLLAFAGLTKAAQMPFQTWLLGAMVAPTPVSALLHSSTMVKAGVFMLIKLAPALGWNYPGIMVMLVGGVTFFICSCMAITQSNAKRVLAYSTIANLGLIAACAGVGTAAAIWAAIFLLIFHAAAKSLLFLCVGTAEHHIGSRDIEDMDDLFVTMPRLARYMSVGILIMFIAPFGMLISKWAAMVAVVDSGNFILLFLLLFGSAVTFVFWAKWLGKIIAIGQEKANIEKGAIHKSEWFALTLMLVLALLFCIALPFASQYLVIPYLYQIFGNSAVYLVTGGLGNDNMLIMSIIVVVLIILFFGFYGRNKHPKKDVYMAGVGIDLEQRTFINSLSQESAATQRNWYMEKYFGEKRLAPIGNWINIVLIAAAVIITLVVLCVGGGTL